MASSPTPGPGSGSTPTPRTVPDIQLDLSKFDFSPKKTAQQDEPKGKKERGSKIARDVHEKIRHILESGNRPSRADTYKWIAEGARLLTIKSDIKKLENTGLISITETKVTTSTGEEESKFVVGPGRVSESSFRSLRDWSIAAWTVTGLATAGAIAGGIALGGGGALAVGCLASFAVNAINWGIQSQLNNVFELRFKSIWNEVRDEFTSTNVERIPAFAGLFHLLVDRYSPIALFPNQTERLPLLTSFFSAQSLTVDALLGHVKDAALGALNNSAGTIDNQLYAKERIELAKKAIPNLEKRWKSLWTENVWWTASLTTGSLIAGACLI